MSLVYIPFFEKITKCIKNITSVFLVFCSYTIRSKQESGLHLSDLLIDNVTLKDNGTYKCVASNSEGPGDRPGEPILIVQGNGIIMEG